MKIFAVAAGYVLVKPIIIILGIVGVPREFDQQSCGY